MPDAPRHRSFETAVHAAKAEPVTFDLGGEHFTCHEEMPALALAGLAEVSRAGGTSISGLFVLMESLLATDEEVERFQTLLHRKTDPISMEILLDVVTWITGEYAGRPTAPPSD